MKIYIVKPKENLPDYWGVSEKENPWEPWYDKSFGIVVRCENEKQARDFAEKVQGDEANVHEVSPWQNPNFSTCEELALEGEPEIIMQDFRSA